MDQKMFNKQVNTEIIKVDLAGDDRDHLKELEALLKRPAEILSENGVVAFPTETVYGLGANALSDEAVGKIYEAKGRPSDNPLIVHISNIDMLKDLAMEVKDYAVVLMDAFWPGPITFVFKKRPNISGKVSGGLDTIAVRMPSHFIAIKLIEMSGKPIAAPSANLSGKPSPTSSRYVIEDLEGRVDCIIDGGDTEVGLESTVLDVTGDVPMILRPGKITQEEIAALVGECEIDNALKGDAINSEGVAKSPGMKYRHYAPEAEVQVIVGSSTEWIKAVYERMISQNNEALKVGVMSFDEDLEVLKRLLAQSHELNTRFVLLGVGSVKDMHQYGRCLFDCLRRFDEMKCDVVIARGVEDVGFGQAIMNRLKKASEGKVTRI